MEFKHVSVLLKQVIEGLDIKPDGIYVDGTLGGGGHSLEICKRINENGKLIGIDQDEEAIKAATDRLSLYKNNIYIHKNNYKEIREVLSLHNIEKVDGILLDLGVSSYQLDKDERGFSYNVDAPLDMRMDRHNSKTAKDIVNKYQENQLFKVIKYYGEERYAKNIARNIVRYRENQYIETTAQLVEIIRKSIPVKNQFTGGHPAKRTFQAIRIELNKELEVLENTLDIMIDLLNDDGRICVITFHSLEDRIVKSIFKRNENPCTCPREFPICICNKKPKGKLVNRKPILPTEEEIIENKRSKSAKLRIFKRII